MPYQDDAHVPAQDPDGEPLALRPSQDLDHVPRDHDVVQVGAVPDMGHLELDRRTILPTLRVVEQVPDPLLVPRALPRAWRAQADLSRRFRVAKYPAGATTPLERVRLRTHPLRRTGPRLR